MANQLFVIHLYLESLMRLKSTDMSCDSALTIESDRVSRELLWVEGSNC